MQKIAITGNLASGKSFVCRALSLKLRCPLFSSDAFVASILQQKDVQNLITFYLKIEPTKEALRETVFTQSIKSTNSRKILESIVYRRLRLERKMWTQKHSKYKILLYEVPLLFEKKLANQYNNTICIYSSKDMHCQFIKSRGLKHDFAERIMQNQIPLVIKAKLANKLFYNSLNPIVFRKRLNLLSKSVCQNRSNTTLF
jgi:dephospho-CoA kinase